MEEARFTDVEIVTHTPLPEAARLGPIAGDDADGDLHELRQDLNRKLEKLDYLLFSDQEYHVIGRKP